MNIKKWIEENTKHTYDRGVRVWGEDFIDIEDLNDLLKTHAIVPREPSCAELYKMRMAVTQVLSMKPVSSYGSVALQSHYAMIKAAEND